MEISLIMVLVIQYLELNINIMSPSWLQTYHPYYENMYYFIISFQNHSINHRYVTDYLQGVRPSFTNIPKVMLDI